MHYHHNMLNNSRGNFLFLHSNLHINIYLYLLYIICTTPFQEINISYNFHYIKTKVIHKLIYYLYTILHLLLINQNFQQHKISKYQNILSYFWYKSNSFPNYQNNYKINNMDYISLVTVISNHLFLIIEMQSVLAGGKSTNIRKSTIQFLTEIRINFSSQGEGKWGEFFQPWHQFRVSS